MSDARRVLVTGATGFIGRHALEPLRARGYEVHAVSTQQNESSADISWHRANLLDPSALTHVVSAIKPAQCLHFAWYAVHGKFWAAPENIQWVEASLRLMRELAQHGCERIVMAGTCAEYDWSHGECDEKLTPLNPATLYGVSKNSLRTLLAAYCAREGISHAWGRMFLMYGPNESPQRLVPAVIRACLEGKAPQCSHGRQIRDFLHVRDVAEAFAALLESPIEGAVNIGSGDSISLRDLVTKIVELCGGSPANFGVVPAAPNDPPVLVPRVERLRNEVGWKASIGLENGLLETIEALKKRGTAI